MAWMETDYSKHTYFRWKIKWRLEHLGALGIMGEAASGEILTMTLMVPSTADWKCYGMEVNISEAVALFGEKSERNVG